ncbi:MAG: PD-(D/E)XK nuclease family protein [Bacilli bacterium]
MDLNILNNSLIISNNKKELLEIKKSNPFLNFKIINKKELFSNLFFHYDSKANLYLYRKGILLDNTDEILNNLYFLKPNINSKIDNLISLKNELEQNKLLLKEDFYQDYLKNKKIILYDLDLDIELKSIFEQLNIQPIIINNEFKLDKCVYEFNNFDEEIRFIFEQIALLIEKGIPLNKIKILTNNELYISSLKKYENYFSFKFNFSNEEKIIHSNDIKLFKSIFSSTNLDETLTQIENRIIDVDAFNKLLRKILEVKSYIQENEIENYIDYITKKIKISSIKYENGIDVVFSLDNLNKEDYLLIPGFILNQYPKIIKDEDYLSDKEKIILNMVTSNQKQLFQENNFIRSLSKFNNVIISYCLKNDKEEYYPSLLIEKYNLPIIKNYEFTNYVYSKDYYNYFNSNVLDEYNNFSFISPYLKNIDAKEIEYKTYNNQFTNINNFILPNMKLSYTSLKTYFECGFKFYLSRILKIDEFEDTLSTKLGTIMHKYLELVAKNKKIDFDELLSLYSLTNKERIIISALKNQIILEEENINNLFNSTCLKTVNAEDTSFSYALNNNFILEGKIDLILSNQNHYVIIDYKTNDSENFSPDLIKYGFSLQLPIYYLLTKNGSSNFINKDISGLYINTILSKNYFKNDFKYLLLNGLTFNDNFNLIQGEQELIKKQNKNYISYDNEEFKNNIETTSKIINEACNQIQDGNFKINPKVIQNKVDSCKYCKYKDICYMTYKDIVYLKED